MKRTRKQTEERAATETTGAAQTDNPTTPVEVQYSKALTVRPEKLRELRVLSLDATSMIRLNQVVCQMLSEIYVQKMPGFDAAKTPVDTQCIDILDIVTGESHFLVLHSVLASTLRRAGQPLVGRYFAIRCKEALPGKRYKMFDVKELAVGE